MIILHVNHRDTRHPKAGGLENVLHEISRRWARDGHEVHWACAGFPEGSPEEWRDGIRFHRRGREEIFNFIAGPWLRRRRWYGADVVIEHLSKVACFVPWFLDGRAFYSHVPHLFGKAIFEEIAWPIGLYVYALERMIPRVYGRYPLWATSASTESDLAAIGFPRERIEVINDGVDHAFYDKEPHPSPAPTVLFLGRIRRYKGVADPLLKAWPLVLRKRPDARLEIVGKGDYEATVRATIAENGLDGSVTMTGFVTEEQKLERIRSAWLLVNPSAKEGWGLSVIEAAAVGVPTVAANVPGLRDAVRDGETGLLVPHGDATALADAILRVIDDGALRRRLGQAARAWSRNFDWDRMAERVLEFVSKRGAS
jgi:glycosyltransferase involved in cell wall biosynthesis